MDIGELKKQSDLSYDIAIAKRNALEKAHSRLIIVYNEHIFRADPQTICLVKTLKETVDKFFILDTNNNPVEIQDPEDFLKKLIERNQECLSSYHQMYKTFERKGD
jgi:hypothetical protein